MIACLATIAIGCGRGRDESSFDVPGDSFVAFRRDNQIWTARGDGTGQKRLTDGFDASPAISPDGQTIVFEHSEGTPYKPPIEPPEDDSQDPIPSEPPTPIGLCAVPFSGGEPRLITPASWLTDSGWTPPFDIREGTKWISRSCSEPSFSPDGKTVCFIITDTAYVDLGSLGKVWRPGAHYAGTDLSLATMNADGTGEPRLLFTMNRGHNYGFNMGNPRFSPDGSRIYVNYGSGPGMSIDEFQMTGWELTQVSPQERAGPDSTGFPTFGISNALEKIAASRWSAEDGSSRGSIVLMGMDGEDMREIYVGALAPNLADDAYEPLSFTPDGRFIGFASRKAGPDGYKSPAPDIRVLPVEGGKPKEIITGGDQPCFGSRSASHAPSIPQEAAPAVPRLGLFVAFRRHNEIWTADGNGGEQRRLTEGYDASPTVSPDGRTVVYEHRDKEALRVAVRAIGWPPDPPLPSTGLYSIPSDGGTPTLLTPASWLTREGWSTLGERPSNPRTIRNCIEPSFSPDGKTICFIIRDLYEAGADPSSYSAVATMNSDGTGEPRILCRAYSPEGGGSVLSHPLFSPDGSEIYVNCTGDFNSGAAAKRGIYKVSSDGGELVLVGKGYKALGISNKKKTVAAVFENKIVLMGMEMDAADAREIYAAPSPSEGAAQSADQDLPPISHEPLSFSPTGESIAFVDNETYTSTYRSNAHKPPSRIYVVPIDGGKPRMIIANGDQPCYGQTETEP